MLDHASNQKILYLFWLLVEPHGIVDNTHAVYLYPSQNSEKGHR